MAYLTLQGKHTNNEHSHTIAQMPLVQPVKVVYFTLFTQY